MKITAVIVKLPQSNKKVEKSKTVLNVTWKFLQKLGHCVISSIFWYDSSLRGLVKLKIKRMILELAVLRLFFTRTRSYTQKFTQKNLEHLSAPNVPGSICWFSWKCNQSMFDLNYLEVWPANVSASLPWSMTGQCICWFTWKCDRPKFLLV